MRAMSLRYLSAPAALLLLAASASADVLPAASQRFAVEDVEETPDFQRHVLPMMTRLGCNGRACHGSFQGRGGFRLSLFGYDFKVDHEALVGGDYARADAEAPAESLILTKPTLEEDHEGGERMKVGSWQYRLLLRWIEGGAKNVEQPSTLDRLEVTPEESVFTKLGETFQLKVVAHWADGTAEDVTPLCRFRSNDDAIATIDEEGLVTAVGKGDTHVVAFYDNGVAPVQAMLPVSDLAGDKYPEVPTPTAIDDLVTAKLRKLGVVPAELCTDAEFLRRVSLDMTGTLPTPEEVEAFLADTSADKRGRKIDELLERPGYAAWWATRMSDWTANNPTTFAERVVQAQQGRQWYEWMRQRLADNAPYDQIVEGIVVATSRSSEEQSYEDYCKEMSGYYHGEDESFAERETMPFFWSRFRQQAEPEQHALRFAYAFLGVRLQCAQCHKHPFDQWTKQDFEQFTAFFNRISYGRRPEDREAYQKMVEELGLEGRGGQVRRQLAEMLRDGKTVPWDELFVAQPGQRVGRRRAQQVSGRVVTPKLLGGDEVGGQVDDPRQLLMDWMRQEGNPYFASAFVNRVWANYFGVGIVDPPDDQSLANPPSNKALMEHLVEGFIGSGYDIKWLHREITTSRTYQLSWKTNETNVLDRRNFSHAQPRRLEAEVVADAVQQATAGEGQLAGFVEDVESRNIGPGSGNGRARQASYMLSVFGQPVREDNCDCERSAEASLLQTLFMQNDREMLGAIERRGGWLDEVARENRVAFTPAAPQNNRAGQNRQAQQRRKQLEQQIANAEKRLAKLEEQGNKEAAAKLKARIAQGRKQLARLGGQEAKPGAEPKRGQPRKPDEVVEVNADEYIRQAYLRSVSRPPTDEELARARQHVQGSENLVAGLRDVLWALLNTKEFILNH